MQRSAQNERVIDETNPTTHTLDFKNNEPKMHYKLMSGSKSENPRKVENTDPIVFSSNERVEFNQQPLRIQEFGNQAQSHKQQSPSQQTEQKVIKLNPTDQASTPKNQQTPSQRKSMPVTEYSEKPASQPETRSSKTGERQEQSKSNKFDQT